MSSSTEPSPSLVRPPPLPISKTCVYKTVQNGNATIPIQVDLYLPCPISQQACPILLYIHGGAWIACNRLDYSRPLFHEFLELGFIIASMDYRLLPETSFTGQQEDIRDIEPWLRKQLQEELKPTGLKPNSDKIIVAGGSAGAHLALLTPKLWETTPTAILSLYAPTNLHSVQSLDRRPPPRSPPCTPECLAAGTDYANPPTEIKLAVSEQDLERPRHSISSTFFRKSLVPEFLLRGLIRTPDGKLHLPERGSVGKEEIDEISPLQLCVKYQYPPMYHAMGTADAIFDLSHVHDFHSALEAQGIPCEKHIIPGAVHAFDIREEIGSEVHEEILKPAVAWVAKWVGKGAT